jgi:hypothetical protein
MCNLQEPADSLVCLALTNLLSVLTPAQLMLLSQRMIERQMRGYGEIRVVWWDGHVDLLLSTDSEKLNNNG